MIDSIRDNKIVKVSQVYTKGVLMYDIQYSYLFRLRDKD